VHKSYSQAISLVVKSFIDDDGVTVIPQLVQLV